MPQFHVEICGICCHYRWGAVPVRTVLIQADDDQRFPHYAHIEVQAGGVVDSAGLARLFIGGQPTYVRNGITYEAYRLNGHRITVPSTDSGNEPELSFSFEEAVPRLLDICPQFGAEKILGFVSDVPTEPVAAHIDITKGQLSAFQFCTPTHFVPVVNDPPDAPGTDRGLATGTRLTVDVASAGVLNITPFAGGITRMFTLEPWVTKVRIANLGENAIVGLNELDSEHFTFYYRMADGGGCNALPVEVPPDEPGKGLGGGCANTQFP